MQGHRSKSSLRNPSFVSPGGSAIIGCANKMLIVIAESHAGPYRFMFHLANAGLGDDQVRPDVIYGKYFIQHFLIVSVEAGKFVAAERILRRIQ